MRLETKADALHVLSTRPRRRTAISSLSVNAMLTTREFTVNDLPRPRLIYYWEGRIVLNGVLFLGEKDGSFRSELKSSDV